MIYIETYNILSKTMSDHTYFINHQKEFIDWKYRTNKICDRLLNNLNSSQIYCFQEVQKKQFKIIEDRLKHEFNFHYKLYSGSMGVLILWTKDLQFEDKHEFQYDTKRGNYLIGVKFNNFAIWTLHLPCLYNVLNADEIRLEFIEEIKQEMNKVNSNHILTGDFNSSPDSGVYSSLIRDFKSSYYSYFNEEPEVTNIFTGKDGISGKSVCDYIFVSENIQVVQMNEIEKVSEDDLIIPNEHHLSDHLPISGYFEISGK